MTFPEWSWLTAIGIAQCGAGVYMLLSGIRNLIRSLVP